MMTKLKHISFWILALFITLTAALYQRITGPTYPKKVAVEFSDSKYEFKLIRSQEIGDSCFVNLDLKDKGVKGIFFYKRLGVKKVGLKKILD